MADLGEHWFNPLAAFVGPAYLPERVHQGDGPRGRLPRRRARRCGRGCGCSTRAADRVATRSSSAGAASRWSASTRHPTSSRSPVTHAGDLPVEFHEADVRRLSFADEFDAVICVCQGGFGLLGGDERRARRRVSVRGGAATGRPARAQRVLVVLRGAPPRIRTRRSTPTTASITRTPSCAMPTGGSAPSTSGRRATRPASFVSWQHVRDSTVDGVFGVTPGRYARDQPSIDVPEHLLVVRRSEQRPE